MERTALLWLPSGTNTGCKQCGRHREHGRDLDASLVEEHRTPFAHAQDGRGATATDFGKGAEMVASLIDGLVVRLRVGCDNREGVGSLHQLDRIEEVANRAVRDCSNKSANGDRQETECNRNAPVTARDGSDRKGSTTNEHNDNLNGNLCEIMRTCVMYRRSQYVPRAVITKKYQFFHIPSKMLYLLSILRQFIELKI